MQTTADGQLAAPWYRPPVTAPRPRAATLVAASLPLGAGVALAANAAHRPTPVLVGAVLGSLAVLALALVRYDAAVALAFVLFAVVRVEPSPSDAIFAIVVALAVATGRFDLRREPLGILVCVAAFLAANAVSSFAALDLTRAARFAGITTYLLLFALWLPSWLDRRERARRLVRIYVGVATVTAAVGSIALFAHVPGHAVLTADSGTRARGLFKDANVFGPFLVPAALLLVQEILHPSLLRSRTIVKVTLLATVAAGILFSYSRGAWLNASLGCVVMLLVTSLRRRGAGRTLVLVGVLATSVTVAATAVGVAGQLPFLRERARAQTYDVERFSAQRGGVALGARSPLGVGPGQFELHEPISAHSTYVRAFAEEGAVGALVLVGLLGGTLALALRNAARGWDTFGISSTVLLGSWCGVLASSVFVDTLHWRHLWLLAGLIWAAAPAHTSSSAGTRPPR